MNQFMLMYVVDLRIYYFVCILLQNVKQKNNKTTLNIYLLLMLHFWDENIK